MISINRKEQLFVRPDIQQSHLCYQKWETTDQCSPLPQQIDNIHFTRKNIEKKEIGQTKTSKRKTQSTSEN